MAITLQDANNYIEQNVIDIDHWVNSDEATKQRILNVSKATLETRVKMYVDQNPSFVLPEDAIFEFCPTLATLFSDEYKPMLNGVSQISASGIASFMFKQSSIKTSGDYSLTDFIPKRCFDIISNANDGMNIGGRRVKSIVF